MIRYTEAINCPVCACALAGAVDVCSRCQTPHHVDCARFYGQCAIFGCFSAAFERSDAAQAGMAVAAGHLTPGEPPAAAPQITRGVLGRARAALELIARNRAASVATLALMLATQFLAPALVQWVLAALLQGAFVILLAARSRGKESSWKGALRLANERGPRMMLLGLLTSFAIMIPMGIGFGMVVGALPIALQRGVQPAAPIWLVIGPGLGCLLLSTVSRKQRPTAFQSLYFMMVMPVLIALPNVFDTVPGFCLSFGLLLILLGVTVGIRLSLVGVVAAVGREEEPGNAFTRSMQLTATAPGQVLTVLVLASGLGGVMGGLIGVGRLFIAIQSALQLWISAYWLLFYIEARRVVKA